MSTRSFLARKISETRKSKGVTQEDLADLAGVTVRTIQRVENGESVPRAFTLKAIATALELDFSELIASEVPGPDITQDAEVLIPTGGPPRDTNSAQNRDSIPAEDAESDAWFMRLLILSCYSFIVIPYVHFLIPMRLLKNRKRLLPEHLSLAKRTIVIQIYWVIAINIVLLLTLVTNLLLAKAIPGHHISYLLVTGVMYGVNGIILLFTLGRNGKMKATSSAIL